MKAGRIFRDFLLIALFAVSLLPCWGDENTVQAIKAAESWLTLVDAKEYAKSWSESAPFFQEKIAENDWVRMVTFVREPLGEVNSRQLLGAQSATNLPGAPAGEYVVIRHLAQVTIGGGRSATSAAQIAAKEKQVGGSIGRVHSGS